MIQNGNRQKIVTDKKEGIGGKLAIKRKKVKKDKISTDDGGQRHYRLLHQSPQRSRR